MPQTTNTQLPSGTSASSRFRLSLLQRTTRGPFTVGDASNILQLDRPRTAKLLAHWASQRWLVRVRRGLYITVPLEAESPERWTEDPWILVFRAFEPCYLGGWTACQHWDLTEQIFRGVVVFTAKPIRRRQGTLGTAEFLVKHRSPEMMFGTTRVWRRDVGIDVSDPSRTIIDVLEDPRTGGGFRHVVSVVRAYFLSSARDDDLLINYAEQLGNGTVFKRLGYITEQLDLDATRVIQACRSHITSGFAQLDPTTAAKGKYNRMWGLLLNARVRP